EHRMRTHSFATEYRVARRLALEAGQAILKSSQDGRGKPIASAAPVACRAASTMILQGIRRDFPADASLTSTTVDRPERVANERVWIIDPLDEAVGAVAEGREFALAIGLAVASTPVVGIVYLPRRRVLYGAAWGAGAWVEQQGTTRP